MCYAWPAMLRGRCSCAISERPTPSSFASPSLTCHLTPLFPLHTQKQGGGWYLFSLSVLPSSALGVYPNPVGASGACPACPELLGDPVGIVRRSCSAFSFSLARRSFSGGGPLVYPACPELRGERSPRKATRLPAAASAEEGHSAPSSVIPGGSNRLENLVPNCKLSAVKCRLSPLSPITPAPLATAALRVVPAPIFTTASSTHVGEPTISCAESVCRASRAGNHYAHRTQLSRAGLTSGAPTALRSKNSQDGSCRSSNCRLSTVTCELSPLSPIIPALTQNRGEGVGYRNGNVSKNCRRADILGVRRLAAAFKVDTVAPYELFDRNGWHRESGSELPHSKKDGHTLPASEGGRYTNFQPSTLNCPSQAREIF